MDGHQRDLLKIGSSIPRGLQAGESELGRNILRRNFGASQPGAAAFQQIVGEEADVGTNLLWIDRRCGLLGSGGNPRQVRNCKCLGMGNNREDQYEETHKQGEDDGSFWLLRKRPTARRWGDCWQKSSSFYIKSMDGARQSLSRLPKPFEEGNEWDKAPSARYSNLHSPS